MALSIIMFLLAVRDILFPFVVGILVGYFLDPLADRLETYGMSRTNATIIILTSFFVFFSLAGLIIVPLLADQLAELIENLPNYLNKINREIIPYIKLRLNRIDGGLSDQIDKLGSNLMEQTGNHAGQILAKVFSSGIWLMNIVALIFVMPVIAFYMLRDWDKFVHRCNLLLPERYARHIRNIAVRVDYVMSGFIRGQLNVCLMLGVFYAIGLTLVGLNYGFLIGFIAGLLAFIPYVGTFLGSMMGFFLAYIQFENDWTKIMVVMLVFALGQFLEGNFITPKLVGDKVKLHPAWLIFGMLAGGSLLGAVGVILAVPITAIVGVVIRYYFENFANTELRSEIQIKD